MPGGGSLLGLGYFVGIKLAGYSLAGAYLNRQYSVESPRPVVFGLARTALGLAVGISYAGLAAGLALERGELIWLVLLLPVRWAEWHVSLWYFYDRVRGSPKRRKMTAIGIPWSFVLDVPALVAAFTLPGGVWIC